MADLPRTSRNGSTPNGSASASWEAVYASAVPDSEVVPISGSARSVAIQVSAELTQLTMLRALTETVCLIADFTISAVTDIRIAVDEIATVLLLAAAPGAEIACELTYAETAMTVRIASVSDVPAPLDEHGFGWRMLHGLTDSIQTETHPFDPAVSGYPTTVIFTRSRADTGA